MVVMALNYTTNPFLKDLLASPVFLAAIGILVILAIIRTVVRLNIYHHIVTVHPDKLKMPSKNTKWNMFVYNFSTGFYRRRFGWGILTGKYQFDDYLKNMTRYIRVIEGSGFMVFIIGAIAFFIAVLS